MTVAGSRRDDEGIRRFVHPQLAFLAGRSACTFMYEYMASDPFLHDLCPHLAPAPCIRTLRPQPALRPGLIPASALPLPYSLAKLDCEQFFVVTC